MNTTLKYFVHRFEMTRNNHIVLVESKGYLRSPELKLRKSCEPFESLKPRNLKVAMMDTFVLCGYIFNIARKVPTVLKGYFVYRFHIFKESYLLVSEKVQGHLRSPHVKLGKPCKLLVNTIFQE